MSCQSKALVLGAIAVLVFSFASYASASGLEDAAYVYSLADGAEEFLAELEYMLEMLEEARAGCEEQESEEKCIIALSILYTFNACWLMHRAGWLSKAAHTAPSTPSAQTPQTFHLTYPRWNWS